VARSLIVTSALQAVLRELLGEGRAVPRCRYDIVAATGLAPGTVASALERLEEACWVTSQVVPASPGRRHPRRDYLLAGEGVSLAGEAIVGRPAARRPDGEVALRVLRVLERAPGPLTTRQVMTAAGDGGGGIRVYSPKLAALARAGHVTRHGSRGSYTWLISASGRDWLAGEEGSRAEAPGERRRQRDARIRAAVNRRKRQLNDAVRESASRHRQPWSGADLETASRDDLTLDQLAAALGRTRFGVQAVRTKLNRSDGSRARDLRPGAPPGPTPAARALKGGGVERAREPQHRALRALPMLRALAVRPQGLTAHDLAVTCAWDIPVRRDALQLAMRTMRQQEKAGRVRRAGTAASAYPRGKPVTRWEITEAGLLDSRPGPGDPATGMLVAACIAEQDNLDAMMAGAFAGGTVLGDRMTGLVAEAMRQLRRKSAAKARLACARENGTAAAAAAEYGKVSAEADAVLGDCAAKGRELVSAGTTSLSAVTGQALRTRDAVIPLIWQLPQGRKAVYALELRKLALLRRQLAALAKIAEGLMELQQAEREMAALDHSLEQADLRQLHHQFPCAPPCSTTSPRRAERCRDA
jgi:uncharacterized protein with PIN domain